MKGAFTDAHSDRIGAFEYANGGTLFLDEVGDMPMSTQIKLLRVLEEHQITRVGDNKPIRVNVRVVSATNRSLEEMVAPGQVPQRPLLPPEGRHGQPAAAARAARGHRAAGRPLPPAVRQAAPQADQGHVAASSRKRLYGYDWPGNVRQLRNALETMVVLDLDGTLDVDDLPPELADVAAAAARRSPPAAARWS